MSPGFKSSIILHLSLLAFMLFEIDKVTQREIPEHVIVVDLLPTAPLTNLENKQAKVEEKKDLQRPQVTPQPVEQKVENKPVEKDAMVKPEKKKKLEKALANDLDKFIDKIDNIQKNKINTEKNKNKNSSNKAYDNTRPLSVNEQDNIKSQIERKFVNPVVMDFKPRELVIRLKLTMAIDGKVESVEALKSSVYSKNSLAVFETLKNSLIRAVNMASPLNNLPPDKYQGKNGWKEIEVSFDAHYLMNMG